MTEFHDWIRKRYVNPVVVVESSPHADAVCNRNGLDAIHILRRYSTVSGPLQASLGEKGEAVVVRNFGVRFVRTDCVREVAPSQMLRHVRHLIWRMAELDLVCGEQLDRVVHDRLMESDSPATTTAASASSPTRTSSGTPSSATSSIAARAVSVAGPSPRPQRVSINGTAFNTLLERSRPPWHGAVVRDLHHLVRATPHETIDYPVGILHVVSTSEPGGVDGVLKVLRAQLKRVHDMRTDLVGMETEMHTFYILIHDVAPAEATPSLRDAQIILAAMKQLYGDGYCALVTLNSAGAAAAAATATSSAGASGSIPSSDPTPWVEANPACLDVPAYTALVREQAREASRPSSSSTSHAAPSPSSVPASLRYRTVKSHFTTASGEKRTTGCLLTREDLMGLESTMAYYVGQTLFRYLERRLRGLDVTVQDRRTTTLRKVAAWLSLKDESKPRAASVAGASDGGPPRYLATAVEMQMRRCGDLSLAFHHYEMAADYYKMCLEELIQTLPDRPYNKSMMAGCQESIGVAYLLMDKLTLPTSTPWTVAASWTSARSHNACRLELAQPMYVGAGLPMNALRLSFLMAEFCRSRMPPAIDRCVGQLKHILKSGLVGRTPLFLAVVEDMLASAYLFTNPPYPSGLLLPPSLPASTEGFPVYGYVRRFVLYLMMAGQHYQMEGVMECALRCFLRVLEVFRSLGKTGSWPVLYERLLDRISALYYTLGYDVKGLAMSSVAVLQGCSTYSDLSTGYAAFQAFWQQQQRVLTAKGFGLSAHMVVPEVVRPSVTIRRNTYMVDDETYRTTRQIGDVAASSEWRVMESHLRNAMMRRLTAHEEAAAAAAAKAGADNASASLTPTPTRLQRLVIHLPRGSHGPVKQLANDDVVLLSRTSTAHLAASATTTTHTATGSFVVAGRVKVTGGSEASAGSVYHFRMHLGEPLKVSVQLHNPVGGTLTATSMCLLYVSRETPSQLWKTASTQTVTIPAQSRAHVHLSFDPLQEGEYVIIGLCWSVLGQEGYYYFATRESRPGCTESLFEYAMAHPMPNAEAKENVSVRVEPPEAWLSSDFQPPLPARMHDGEYFRTTLVVQNKSSRGTARHITLQRSPQNAHLIFFNDFDLETNLSEETALELIDDLAPGQVKKLSVVVRAQHDRGDIALTCYNHIVLLFGFVSEAAAAATVSLASTAVAASPSSRAIEVRVHRLLRRLEVTPLLLLYSTVLPPMGPSLDTTCVLTMKHIPPPARSHAGVAHASVGVSRVLVTHDSRWGVHLAQDVDALLQSGKDLACEITSGSSLTMPIMVRRRSHEPTTDAEEDEQANEAPFRDTECLPLTRAVRTEARARLVANTLGHGLAGDGAAAVETTTTAASLQKADASAFFVRNFFRGAGGVGSNTMEAKAGIEAMAFYKDKGGSAEATAAANRTAAERRQLEKAQEAAMYGAPLETFTPIVVSVAWLLEDADPTSEPSLAARVVCGQSFFLIDTMAFLDRCVDKGGTGGDDVISGESSFASLPHSKSSALITNASLPRALSTALYEGTVSIPEVTTITGDAMGRSPSLLGSDTATLQEQQSRLSDALWSHNSPRGDRGALVYQVSTPLSADTTLSMPTAALAPITFTCLSLSPVPLMVEVCAHDVVDAAEDHASAPRQRPACPVVFVGKTRDAFYVPPSARHTLTLTAHVLVPGVVDCNCLRVRATPLLFQPDVTRVCTGMSACAFLRALSENGDAINTNSFDSALVQRRWGAMAPATANDTDLPCDAQDTTAAAQTRAALLSLATAQARRRSVDIGIGYNSLGSPISPSGSSTAHDFRNSGATSVELALSLLTPRGFLPSHIVVIGAEVPAMIHVSFTRMDAATQEAAAFVFQKKNKVYHRDWHLFEANYNKFKKAQEAVLLEKQMQSRVKTTESSCADGGDNEAARAHVHYVYRPRVKRAVRATGTGPVQLDDLDRLLASPPSDAASDANGSFSQLLTSSSARATAISPPLKGSGSFAGAGASSAQGQSHSSTRPRPPRLLLPQAQAHTTTPPRAAAVGGSQTTAATVPDALFASPILHAAPPLTEQLPRLPSPHSGVSRGAAPPPATPPPPVVAEHGKKGKGSDSERQEDEGPPLPHLLFDNNDGDDSDEDSANTSRIHSTLLSPLHMPSPHHGRVFEQVMPVDSMRDLSEVEVAAAAEGPTGMTTVVVPSSLLKDNEDLLHDDDDDFRLDYEDNDTRGDALVSDGPGRRSPVFSRTVEHRADAHPLKPEDLLAADVHHGMRELPGGSPGGVVAAQGASNVTAGRVVEGRAVLATRGAVSLSPVREEGGYPIIAGTPVQHGNRGDCGPDMAARQ